MRVNNVSRTQRLDSFSHRVFILFRKTYPSPHYKMKAPPLSWLAVYSYSDVPFLPLFLQLCLYVICPFEFHYPFILLFLLFLWHFPLFLISGIAIFSPEWQCPLSPRGGVFSKYSYVYTSIYLSLSMAKNSRIIELGLEESNSARVHTTQHLWQLPHSSCRLDLQISSYIRLPARSPPLPTWQSPLFLSWI